MKNKFFKIWLIIWLFLFSISNLYSYDQTFPSIKLRYWYQYKFSDIFNTTTNQVWIHQVITTFRENDGDLNWWPNPNFPWHKDIIDLWYTINPNQSVRIVESDSFYKILYHPVNRKSNNLEIIYDTRYYRNVWWVWQWPISHTEYQPYEITWCWDWVLDNYFDVYAKVQIKEYCDPNDQSKTWWWNGWCSLACEPITIPTPPSCSNLSVNPLFWTTPHSSNVSCTWLNVDTYRIDCWNGQTINANTWTCNYTSVWTYTPKCYVNWTITSPSCEKTVTVQTPVVPVSCDNLTTSQTSWTNSLTSVLTCTWTRADTYRIDCW